MIRSHSGMPARIPIDEMGPRVKSLQTVFFSSDRQRYALQAFKTPNTVVRGATPNTIVGQTEAELPEIGVMIDANFQLYIYKLYSNMVDGAGIFASNFIYNFPHLGLLL